MALRPPTSDQIEFARQRVLSGQAIAGLLPVIGANAPIYTNTTRQYAYIRVDCGVFPAGVLWAVFSLFSTAGITVATTNNALCIHNYGSANYFECVLAPGERLFGNSAGAAFGVNIKVVDL